MPTITKQELIDAQVDAQALEDIINGPADFGGDGLVTTRLGGDVKTIQKRFSEIPEIGYIVRATWTDLAATTTFPGETVAVVPLTDVGTHTDPVVGGTVNNEGLYRYSKSPLGWQRLSSITGMVSAAYATVDVDTATKGHTEYAIQRQGYLTVNAGAKATRRSDGNYDVAVSATGSYWDIALTADQISAGSVWVEMEIVSGGLTTLTAEQRTNSGTAVAATAIPDIGGGKRYLKMTLDPTTTIIRVNFTTNASTTAVITPPALGRGIPASVPVDPQYLIALLRSVVDDDSEEIASLISVQAVSGTLGTVVDDQTFTVPSGSSNYAWFVLDEPVLNTDELTVLFNITSTNKNPRLIAVAPADEAGNVGTSYTANRYLRDSSERVCRVTAADVSGKAATRLRVNVNTTTGGTDPGTAESITVRARVFKAARVPKFTDVPKVIQQALGVVSDAIAPVSEAATAAQADVDELAEREYSFAFVNLMQARMSQLLAVSKFVDPDGSDANPGTQAAPYATITQALAQTTAGQGIALASGKAHLLGTTTADVEIDRAMTTYGDADTPPMIDARQHISSGWTTRAGTAGCWEKVITHRELTANIGIASNSMTYHVWDDMLHLDWKVGGASIAANVSAVDTPAGGFTVHREGSTVQDPRLDTNATLYRYIIRLPGGEDPNTRDISISDRRGTWYYSNTTHRDVILIGSNSKDFCHTADAPIPTLDGHIRLDCNQHGHVGPCHVKRFYRAYGQPVPGITAGDNQGRCDGGGLNLYSQIDLTAYDLYLDTVEVHNFVNGLYGHGSGNNLYNNVNVKKFIGRNCSTAISLDAKADFSTPLTGTYTVDKVDMETVQVAFGVAGPLVVNGGNVVFSDNPQDPSQKISAFKSGDDIHTIKNTKFEFQFANSITWDNFIAARSTSDAVAVPTLILSGCEVISTPDKRPTISNSINWWKYNLYIQDETQLWDVIKNVGTLVFPTKFFVGPYCRVGFGGLSGPEIDAAFLAAGKVDGVDFHLDPLCEIVGPTGRVISRSGWK